ncbi:MAG: PEP-CTERM-box response regulator transcription factor [Candidatus Binatia bacterium]
MDQYVTAHIDSVPAKAKLLIVDDDENIRTQMKWALARDYTVILAEDRPSALEMVRKESPVVVTLDLGLPPHPGNIEEGLRTLAGMLEYNPSIKVIVITGQTERQNAVQAIGQGAYDFLCKPIDVEDLRGILRRAFYVSQLEQENRHSQQYAPGDVLEGMIGTSAQMHEVFVAIRRVAATDASVLIVGESGTGKELAARAIHRLSGRANGPFVAINCGAIPENLLESELFGHEKGAFTNAHTQRKGRVEGAQNGTLFLDEVGELPLQLQVKLLRFLQERVIERIGGRGEIAIDTRVLAATNADLDKAMKAGRFREDLYYRLGVVVLAIPPLRERGGDILRLATLFLDRYSAENKKKAAKLSQSAIQALENHTWPGNVRELENRIKRAVIMADGNQIFASHLELNEPEELSPGKRLKDAREAVEREMVQRALVRNKNNLTQAAAELGISRPTLYELMNKLGIEKS